MHDLTPYPPIAEYALLADCHSAALVSRAGSIDWACFRRFDSGSAFGRLLDWHRGGHFHLAPAEASDTARRYVGDTLILETTWEGATGSVRVRDALLMREGGELHPSHELIRLVEGMTGVVEMSVVVEPRFDYGALRPWLRRGAGEGVWVMMGGDDALVLSTDVRLRLDEDGSRLRGRFSVAVGQRWVFSLHAWAAHELAAREPAGVRSVADRLAATEEWWERWSAGTVSAGPYTRHVRRSAVVLKGLTCAPTGAIVAAPTTSLPEQVGGSRNWDYRYCWVRDSTLALEALDAAGHREVARGFRDFLLRSAAGHADDLQIMYGCYGERRLPESELALEGYRGSLPVRVGNAAAGQRQLDVYGHVLDAARYWQVAKRRPDADEWRFLRQVVDAAADVWREPDRGIWEVRGSPQHFVYSKVMCWVALDRGIDMAERYDEYDADLNRWRTERDRIREDIDRRGVSRAGHFTQSYGSDDVDASLLKLPAVGFVPARDQRMLATVAAVRERLEVPGTGFLRRYSTDRTDDGLSGDEGAFLLCTFWLIDLLAMQDELDEAERLFEQVLAAGNDLGLFAEEYDPRTGELLGNFPQTFTHLGVIQSALHLSAARGR